MGTRFDLIESQWVAITNNNLIIEFEKQGHRKICPAISNLFPCDVMSLVPATCTSNMAISTVGSNLWTYNMPELRFRDAKYRLSYADESVTFRKQAHKILYIYRGDGSHTVRLVLIVFR